MSVSTFQQSNLSSQAQVVDGDVSVLARIGAAFAPHAQATPNLSVVVDPGHLFDGTSLTEVPAQSAASFTAPTANPRIDRVVIDQLTGIVSVVSGAEAASPTAPAIPNGKAPVAQVMLQTKSVIITNDMITDERDLSSLGRIIAVEAGTGLIGGGTAGVVTISLEAPVPVALGGTGTATAGANKVFAGPVSGADAAPSFRALKLADLPSDVATTEQVTQAIVVAAPPGAVQHFAMSTAPSGWLAANGTAVSRVTYAALFAAIGTTFGGGDGSTSFNLPDLRGEFARGWDNGRGFDPNRTFGSNQADTLGSHAHGVNDSGHTHGVNDPGHGHSINDPGHLHNMGGWVAGEGGSGTLLGVGGSVPTSTSETGVSINAAYTGINNSSANAGVSITATGGAETRPRNVALLACIKY